MLSTQWPAGWTNQDESIALGNLRTSYGAVIQDLSSGIGCGAKGIELRKIVEKLKARQKWVEKFLAAFDEAHQERFSEYYNFNISWVLIHKILDK